MALAVAFLIVPTVAAQSQWEQQVQEQIASVGESLIDDGYELTHVSTDEALKDGGAFELWVDLTGGVDYAIVGVCDADCSDVDLEIFDSEGNAIDSDYETDDFPVVTLIPNRSARFRVHVSMATCSVEPCSWGVGVFGR